MYLGGDTTDETFITVLKNILNIYQASQDDIIWTAPLHYGRLNEGSECARTCKDYHPFYNHRVLTIEN